MAVRVLIAGSDASARKKIKRTLRQETGVEIVGESADGFETVLLIEKHEPDLVFLEIKIDKKPFVIFVSATESLAAKAFEIGAADYLVKPFSKQRLQTAFNRTRERIEGRQNGSIEKLLDSFLNKLSAKKDFPDKIMLKTAKGVYFINTGEIDWIEAAGNYVKLHVKDSGHLLRETMNNIEAKLNPDKFLRIHRSHLVNIDRIKELQPLFNGDYIVILHDNTELNLSRNYHDRLQRLFDKFS
jgi:two-component system, LytTR family, response regulator